MKNKFRSNVLLVALLLALTGCTHLSLSQSLKVLPDQGPVRLEMRPTIGTGDTSDYRSVTVTKSKPNAQAQQETTDEFNFTVDTKVTHVDNVNNLATYRINVLKKDGPGELADFAMPDIGETLDLVLTRDGQVVKAGDYPPGSLYYVAPTSLPKDDVKVGDTWLMRAEWVSLKSGVPMHLEVVSTLKSIRDCGAIGRCAEIEISGDETIIGAASNPLSSKVVTGKTPKKAQPIVEDVKMRFKSEMKGRVLFSIEKGAVLFSYMRSEEHMTGEKDTLDSDSCMTSTLVKPEAERSPIQAPAKCDPHGEIQSF